MLQDESMSGLLNVDVHVYFAESDRDRDLRAAIVRCRSFSQVPLPTCL